MSSLRPSAALPALLLVLAACGYPDTALMPSARPPAQAPAAETAQPADDFGLGTPFVVIRFGFEPVDFEETLAGAVAEARARRPNATFHLLAVAAGSGPQVTGESALSHAEAVLRSLVRMGVAPGDIVVSAAASPAVPVDEVRLYLR